LSKYAHGKTRKSNYLGALNPTHFGAESVTDRVLILGSSSLYRRALLERLGLPFSCVSPNVDETPGAAQTPAATAMRLALAKAQAVAAAHAQAVIIASDQVADLDGMPLGKPGNHANALRQLRAMSGRRVVFHTALCLLDAASGEHQLENVPTTVFFRDLGDAQIERYLQREQPYDCAGSAKIECLGVTLVSRVESGDPTALIGLPLITLVSMLQHAGIGVI
jgi:septum formation protein